MSDSVKNALEWVECIVIAIILAVLIRYYVGTPTIVKQESMYPTLKPNERLILNRLPKTTGTMPERGDIITFEAQSMSNVVIENFNANDPIAKYENEPNTLFSKFVYYVLEYHKTSYIKRVIGLPGEHIKIENGKVYVDDVELDEPYLQEGITTTTLGGVFNDLIVPENCVFAMGDNRTKSTDCRIFGCIPLEKIEGKVVIRFYPLDKFGKINK